MTNTREGDQAERPEPSSERRDVQDDPADPPTHHLGLDPELGPPPEGYGGKPSETDYDAPDSERTTGEVIDSDR
jgi:hypothetical protein